MKEKNKAVKRYDHEICKHLNGIDGFVWIEMNKNDNSLGKTTVCNESFWLRDCKRIKGKLWRGIVDNDLFNTDKHGLQYNDTVIFEVND